MGLNVEVIRALGLEWKQVPFTTHLKTETFRQNMDQTFLNSDLIVRLNGTHLL